MRRVAIAGATGYVGGRLLARLLADGDFEIAALARTPEKLDSQAVAADGRLTVHRADVQDPLSLAAALEGAEFAYYLVHSLGAGSDFGATDVRGASNFAKACAQAGVSRIIYLSGLGSEGDDLSEHLSSRHDTGHALRESGVPVTELRAAIIVGSGSASFEIIRDLSRKLPLMITPRWVRSRCEPIGIRDVVSYLTGVLDQPRTSGETLEIGGGDVLTYADMMRICADEQGKHCYILTVPVLTPRLSSYWLHLVTSADMKIARPLIDGLRNDVVCTDTRIRDWIPLSLSGYRLSVRRALERKRPRRSTLRIRPSAECFVDSRLFESELSPDEAFARIMRIGGEFGYGAATGGLWKIRGVIDRLSGGPGLRRGRPFGDQLRSGDVVDFWRVATVDAPRRLELVAEMRLPGEARLCWEIEPSPGGSTVRQTATLTNESLMSGIYWYSIAPAHSFVFNRMGRHLVS